LVLLRAAKLCEQGWCQGAAWMENKRCAWAGIDEATSQFALQSKDAVEARSFAEHLVRDATGCISVAAWNDAPGRKKAEVVAMLREVAES
jgi:hypothetical protein